MAAVSHVFGPRNIWLHGMQRVATTFPAPRGDSGMSIDAILVPWSWSFFQIKDEGSGICPKRSKRQFFWSKPKVFTQFYSEDLRTSQ